MNVLIVEDEINAVEFLSASIKSIAPEANILANTDSVQDTLNFLQTSEDVDLIFMDIQLSDGLSFEIFNHIDIKTPIIFTTAYDQYAIDAFKVYSVDYLLKPIHKDDLKVAIDRYKKLYQADNNSQYVNQLQTMVSNLQKRKKNRCLVKKGGHYEYVDTDDIAFVNSEDSITFLHTIKGQRLMYSKTIESLYQELDQNKFFQINRSQIVQINSIAEIHPYFNQRLKVILQNEPKPSIEFIVSRNKVSSFKDWLDK